AGEAGAAAVPQGDDSSTAATDTYIEARKARRGRDASSDSTINGMGRLPRTDDPRPAGSAAGNTDAGAAVRSFFHSTDAGTAERLSTGSPDAGAMDSAPRDDRQPTNRTDADVVDSARGVDAPAQPQNGEGTRRDVSQPAGGSPSSHASGETNVTPPLAG